MNTIIDTPDSPLDRARGNCSSPLELDIDTLHQYLPVVRCKLAAGEYVYRMGQPFRALYLVHAGSLKSCELAEDGREQVTSFRIRGDLIGVESIGLSHCACDAIALEHCEIWELPYPPVIAACLQLPALQARLTASLAEEIRRHRSWMLALGTLNAEQRVAAFLLDMARDHARLGFSDCHFVLRMGRNDMASFLGIQHETVTRALSRLQELGYIAIQRREVRLLDGEALRFLACGERMRRPMAGAERAPRIKSMGHGRATSSLRRPAARGDTAYEAA
ncbi:Crp/Fnr family transcriptional regulator [Frateuria defendens]|uniref:Crp/Fnr family transcriptional regulator n=1 Tax=Frateuria defendens TaxID=2219559 RepID=UPI00066FCCFA|nr:Crp/Fnr family transcriptional regulator [Frateuria defendens]